MTKDQQKYIIQAIVFASAVFYFVKQSAASSSVQNGNKQLVFAKARANGLPSTQLDPLLIKLEGETNLRGDFQDLNSEFETKVVQLLVKQNERLDALQEDFEAKILAKIDVLMARITQPKKETRLQMNIKHEHYESSTNNETNNNMKVDRDEKKCLECCSAHTKLPSSSCRQLALIGHSLDGIYLIADQGTSKIETVYCNFGTNPSETLYGNVSLKKKSAHFYVQRISDFASNNAVIPFDIEQLNEGGAMKWHYHR